MAAVFETRFAFRRTIAQSARTVGRPDVVFEFPTEPEALEALKAPPKGAKAALVRQLAPERRFIKSVRL